MYEVETNRAVEPIQLPPDIVVRFRELREKVAARTVLPWGEHCTECVWPTCYRSCDLYNPREDGRCRRFIDGMVRVDCAGSVNSYLLKIRFKRWGKLWSPGNIRLVSLDEADRIEERDRRIGSVLNQLPVPRAARNFIVTKRYTLKKRTALNGRTSTQKPDLFVIECYNPGRQTVHLSLTVRSAGGPGAFPYQRLIPVSPGFHREGIPVEDITRIVDLQAPFGVDLIPNDIPDDTALFFGLLDFVTSKEKLLSKTEPQSVVKCVVWDLDNTLWDGVLVEDGPQALRLKPGVIEVIQELDRRGILHSIASKNNFDDAMRVLKSHSLDDYFLYPQISWDLKSDGMKTIAHSLNIATSALLFIDDSAFELTQVQSACSEIRVLPAARYRELLLLPECQTQPTEESGQRRKMYQQQVERQAVAKGFTGDYLDFLRDCRIELRIASLSASNLERVHELTQRTNQMNFSGNRYERTLLQQIEATPNLDTYVIECRDRFGSYGIVGFSIVDSRTPKMIDLMFSCRVQGKRVEHAVISYLLHKYAAAGTEFWADYRKTERNALSGRVFLDLGMEERAVNAGVTSMVFPEGRPILDDGIVQIVECIPCA